MAKSLPSYPVGTEMSDLDQTPAPFRDSEYQSRFPKQPLKVVYQTRIITIIVMQRFSLHKDTHCFLFKSINVLTFFFLLKALCSPESL